MRPVLKINVDKEKPLVIVAPLDWGLGHTTRIIPIINALGKLSCNIVIACNSRQKSILQKEVAGCQYLDLAGYEVKYGRSRSSTILRLLLQVPRLMRRIRDEQRWLKQLAEILPIDLVISDNRYGLSLPGKRSVFISHQLSPKSGLFTPIDRWARKVLNRFVQLFTDVWIPDLHGANSIAGDLSLAHELAIHPKHIGILTRIRPCDKPEVKNRLLIVLSGPEPQRSIFEEKIYRQCLSENIPATLVRGIPESSPTLPPHEGLTIHNFLSTKALNEEICEAEWILCRPGYSSLMDLLPLQKKLITIPTPGQPEQQYLAEYLQGKNRILFFNQTNFDLSAALKKASEFHYQFSEYDRSHFETVLIPLIEEIKDEKIKKVRAN